MSFKTYNLKINEAKVMTK